MSDYGRKTIFSFDGEYYQLDDASISPSLFSSLFLWVGGSSKQAIERTASGEQDGRLESKALEKSPSYSR
ncbi:MAG: hypothetical protein Ct9H90mP27_6320 [Gammaproteobacteria bacterium]|nr:MAG: hypothetical protein Ct9H90mP27_6320 [Gammaproteobacteria bacterium]